MSDRKNKSKHFNTIQTEKDLQNLFDQIRKANLDRIPDDERFRSLISNAMRRERESRKKRGGLAHLFRLFISQWSGFSTGAYATAIATLVIIFVGLPIFYLSREKDAIEFSGYDVELKTDGKNESKVPEQQPAPSPQLESRSNFPSAEKRILNEQSVGSKMRLSSPVEAPAAKIESGSGQSLPPSPMYANDDLQLSEESYSKKDVDRRTELESAKESVMGPSLVSEEQILINQLSTTQDITKKIDILEKLAALYKKTGTEEKLRDTLAKLEKLKMSQK